MFLVTQSRPASVGPTLGWMVQRRRRCEPSRGCEVRALCGLERGRPPNERQGRSIIEPRVARKELPRATFRKCARRGHTLLPTKTFFYSAVNPAALWLASQKGLVLLRPQRQKATRPPRSISSPALLITLTSPCTSSGPLARMVMVAADGVGVWSKFDMVQD